MERLFSTKPAALGSTDRWGINIAQADAVLLRCESCFCRRTNNRKAMQHSWRRSAQTEFLVSKWYSYAKIHMRFRTEVAACIWVAATSTLSTISRTLSEPYQRQGAITTKRNNDHPLRHPISTSGNCVVTEYLEDEVRVEYCNAYSNVMKVADNNQDRIELQTPPVQDGMGRVPGDRAVDESARRAPNVTGKGWPDHYTLPAIMYPTRRTLRLDQTYLDTPPMCPHGSSAAIEPFRISI